MMMENRRRLMAMALVFLLVILPSCAKEDSSRPMIALVMKSLANEFFKTMEEGARAHQKSHDDQYSLIANGIKDEQDVDRQIDIVEQMIGRGVDAIIIAPTDSKALIPMCKKAMDAGITVINIDNKFDNEVLESLEIEIPFVGPDNRSGARLAGEYLGAQLDSGDKVAIIEGIPTAFNSQQRRLGFEDAMRAANIQVLQPIQSGRWETDVAYKLAASMLIEHKDLKAFLCGNDSMALGVYNALREAGMLGRVKVVGYDNITAVRDLLREGHILCTIDQHADRLAVYGIEYALDIINGGTAPVDKETPVDLIAAENLQ
jgi:ribose transport system substrate-binding protein